jgi:phospholipase/carboxylesterase
MTTPLALDGPRFGPAAGGRPRQIVVLLHGWGADGNDLIGLAPMLAATLPHALFLSPHAPFPHEHGGLRQWYSLGDMRPDGDLADARMIPRVEAVRPILDAFLDGELAKAGLGGAALALVGFSQGTMVSLYCGPRRTPASGPAAIVGFSGRMVGAATLDAASNKPPVLLIHGEWDDVLPAESSRRALADLEAAGFKARLVVRPRLGHGIDEAGIDAAARFLKEALKA